MQTIIIVVHLMIVLALVGVVLLQRSEGGGLGIGGGSGFMTARGAANTLTRATAILAAAFFVTSLGLSILARYGAQPLDILNQQPPAGQGQGQGVLDQLGGGSNVPAPPATTPPATTAPATEGAATPPAAAPQSTESAPAAPPAAAAPEATDIPAAPATPAQPAAPQVPN